MSDIDSTIDQLIENGETLQKISTDPHYEIETAALKKMQESLLAHLIHLQDHFQKREEGSHTIDRSIKKRLITSRLRVHHSKMRTLQTRVFTNLK